MTTTTPLFQIGETFTVEVEGRRARVGGDFFKVEGYKNDRHFYLFVHQPDDPPREWWNQVCAGDKLVVEYTGSATSPGISGNAKALPLKDQFRGLKRAIRDRQNGFNEKGGSVKLTYSISLDDHAELTHLTKLMKKDDPSIRQEDICRDLLSKSLFQVKVSRLQFHHDESRREK